MSDQQRWKPWLIGGAIVAGIAAWFWWQAEHPELANGDYWCEGLTVATDGSRSFINANAQVIDHDIVVGQTGLDLVMGHTVTSWGDVDLRSRSEFLVEIHPSNELAGIISDSFWITCQLD